MLKFLKFLPIKIIEKNCAVMNAQRNYDWRLFYGDQ